jgi:hypothetical protein
MKTDSSTVSCVGPPLSLPKGERKIDPESIAATANMKLYVDDRRCRSTTSMIDNAPHSQQ